MGGAKPDFVVARLKQIPKAHEADDSFGKSMASTWFLPAGHSEVLLSLYFNEYIYGGVSMVIFQHI